MTWKLWFSLLGADADLKLGYISDISRKSSDHKYVTSTPQPMQVWPPTALETRSGSRPHPSDSSHEGKMGKSHLRVPFGKCEIMAGHRT